MKFACFKNNAFVLYCSTSVIKVVTASMIIFWHDFPKSETGRAAIR